MRWFLIFSLFFSMQIPIRSFAQTAEEIRRIMSSQSNFYDVLGIKQNASSEEIRSAYRSLLRSYYPDHYRKDPEKFRLANEVMKKLNVSRDILMDPLKRQKYDRTVKVSSPPPPQSRPYSQETAKQAKWSNAKKWTPEDFSKSQKASAAKNAPTSQYTRQATKAYEETAKCGAGYFKTFVDILL